MKTVAQILDLAKDAGVMIGTAESCTGGLICGALTDVPGSSACVAGGIVSYSNAVKEQVLGVSPDTLRRFGAVSEPTAQEMATGALRQLGCDLTVAVTGIAGPGGGTAEKPEGRVCFALAGTVTRSWTRDFGALGRAEVRAATVQEALDALTETLSAR